MGGFLSLTSVWSSQGRAISLKGLKPTKMILVEVAPALAATTLWTVLNSLEVQGGLKKTVGDSERTWEGKGNHSSVYNGGYGSITEHRDTGILHWR